MAIIEASLPCPICRGPLSPAVRDIGVCRWVECLNCGDHHISDEAMEEIKNTSDEDRPRLAHGIVKLPRNALVESDFVRQILRVTKLPPALERIDNLVQHLALDVEPGLSTRLNSKALVARLGCERSESALWVIKQAKTLEYVDTEASGNLTFLTAAG